MYPVEFLTKERPARSVLVFRLGWYRLQDAWVEDAKAPFVGTYEWRGECLLRWLSAAVLCRRVRWHRDGYLRT